MVRKSKLPPVPLGLQRVLNELQRHVSALSSSAVKSFMDLYTGKISPSEPETKICQGNSIKAILDSSYDPLSRAKALVHLIDRLVQSVDSAKKKWEEFERSDEATAKFEEWKKRHLITCMEASLLLKEALDKDIFPLEQREVKIPKEERVRGGPKHKVVEKKSAEQKAAEKMVQTFIGWNLDTIFTAELPEFGSEDIPNVALFQQLTGGIPVAPIADSIMPFKLLEWQERMFAALRARKNVVVSAPTSSGKTMVALGYIVAFLKMEAKSKLVYVVPNNVLAMEVSAILNKYQDGMVSTILDKSSDRRTDERVIVCTPSGAINSGFIHSEMPENSLLVVDEVHTIANVGGSMTERILRKFSSVQTLLLSATMTEETVEALVETLENRLPTERINERTQFIVPQDMIPRMVDGQFKLIPSNPLGGVTLEELKDPNLDIAMTPRDVNSLFIRIVKVFGMTNVPEYLAPVRFFCLHSTKPSPTTRSLKEAMADEDEDAEGVVNRLSMEDIREWQKHLLAFLNNPPESMKGDDWEEKVEKILASYRMSLTDEDTLEYSPDALYDVIMALKEADMFPALCFNKNLYGAIRSAQQLMRLLATIGEIKGTGKEDRAKKSKVRVLEKLISSLEKAKGNGRELRERRRQMEEELANEVHGEMLAVPPDQCLSKNGGIYPETFTTIVEMLKRWNKKFTQSHSLAQMLLHGIGVLSGDMPLELQMQIRQLYQAGTIALLFTTSDCAYGINTPTKTVILGPGLTAADMSQMGGRAGRKGLGFEAMVVKFRCGVEEAKQHLRPLVGEQIEVFGPAEDMSGWFTRASRRDCDVDDPTFYDAAYLMLGMGACIAPSILENALAATVGESNREIKILLSLLPSIPQNKPCSQKEGWSYRLPEDVCRIYEQKGVNAYPNATVYDWLMNQQDKLTEREKEELVENAKSWSYLVYLLKDHFRESDLYDKIQTKILERVISTSTSLD